MPISLNGKVALVTGGTRGIGLAISKSLLDAGATVVVCGRSQSVLEDSVGQLRALTGGHVAGIPADVSKIEDVRKLFEFVDEEMGGLDVLINNAGIGVFRAVADLTIEEWRETIETNLTGTFYCCHEAMPRFRKRGGGYVINISSLAGKNSFAGGAAYNASKFGMNGFSEAMMQDHRYENVRVSYIMPGSVDTEFSPRTERGTWKIAAEDVAEVVMMLLGMPERTLVSRVEMRPSKPKK
jgi:3-oxoacyl-[acyl-carrier protein] reductase